MRSQNNSTDMTAERESIVAQISEGFEQAERGELINADDAKRELRDRRAKRLINQHAGFLS